jgi:hypothetical protein
MSSIQSPIIRNMLRVALLVAVILIGVYLVRELSLVSPLFR